MDGFLPKIKCSSCGVDIDISQLADHICANNASSSPEVRSPEMERSGAFGGPSFSKRSEGRRQSSGRMPPPSRIDPYAANKPFRPMDTSPVSDYSNGLPSSGRSPYQGNRSATSPMPRTYGVPSPDLTSNMDNPFPPFPKRGATPRSAKPQPVERSETGYLQRYGEPSPGYSQRYAEPSPLFAPLSPNINGGERIAKRMDTIKPGPFDGREDRRPSTSSGPRTPAQEQQPMGHRRTATQSSVKSNNMARTSLASTMSHGSNYSNGSIGLPSRPKPGMGGVPPVPPKRQPSKTEGIDAFLDRLQKESMGSSDRAPRTRQSPTRKESPERRTPPPRPRRPSEAERGRQDSSNGGYSAFTPRSNNLFPSGGSIRTDSGAGIRRNDLPLPSYGNQQSQNSLHTPSDSGQSDDSYASGFRSVASSRSSPPQSEAGHSRQASKVGRSNYLGEEPIQRTTSPETYEDRRAPPSQGQTRYGGGSYTRRNAPEPARAYTDIPESPMDPAIQMGMTIDKRPTEPAPRREPAATLPRNPPRSVTEPDRRQLSSRRAPGASKGTCRGCEQPIYGKSVKDSSGRLTGRYHKECFVCKTCSDPFPTADFYVFENSPFCEQHYHELNGSLCQSCNRGIEGQYLETDVREKFHPRCFTCSTCRIVLRDDYYEVGRSVYCERHAYAVMSQQKSTLGPGGPRTRNLQKRRTRMMMMG